MKKKRKKKYGNIKKHHKKGSNLEKKRAGKGGEGHSINYNKIKVFKTHTKAKEIK